MADTKISGLADGVAGQATDQLPAARAGTTVRIPVSSLAATGPPAAHAAAHANGGADEVSVTGLSGLLADGQTPLAHATSHESGGGDALKLDDLAAPDDTTDLNVTSSKHGLVPKSPGDATQFLNGAATAAFAAVKESDLALTDITTNNATTLRHGFAPTLSNVATEFLNGVGAYSTPTGGAGDASTDTATSVDSEVALFSSTTGKLLKRATGTGVARLASGVQSAAELSGDVTTSGSNAATIAADAVTYAKMQNVSAASKLLGRGDSGSGDPQEITLGTGLTMTGATLAASGGAGITLYDTVAAALAINTSSSEETVYSFTLGAGALGTTGKLRVTLRGDLLANSGTPTFTWRIKLGATTLWGDASSGLGASSTRGSWILDFVLANQDSAAVQAMHGMYSVSNRAQTAAVAGIGDISNTPLMGGNPLSGAATEDTTGALTVAVTVTMSVSNSAVETRRQVAYAELVA